MRTFQGHQSFVWSVVFHPDGERLISSSDDRTVKIWHRQTGQCLQTLTAPNSGSICSVAVSPDGGFLAAGSQSGAVYLWELGDRYSVKRLEGHQIWTWSVAFSPDSQLLASGSDDGTVRVWQVRTGECLRVYEGAIRSPGVAFSPDGKLLAGASDQSINIWEVRSGQLIQQLHGHNDIVRSLAFTRDSKALISGSINATIKLWDLDTGKCLRTDKDYSDWIVSIAVHPNGKTFMTNTTTSELRLQSIQTGECLKTLQILGPYEGMNITGVRGLSSAQKSTLKQLGAVDPFTNVLVGNANSGKQTSSTLKLKAGYELRS